MYRRLLTLLLLTTLLLTQWVSGSRCMGGCGVTGLDSSRPHVHLNAAIPGLTDTKGCACQRQREAATPKAGQPTTPLLAWSISQAPSEPAPCHDTDDHVLYLSFDAANGGRTSGGDEVRTGGEHEQQLVVLGARHLWPDHQCDSFAKGLSASSPPSPGCPVYLRVRSLLI